MPVLPRTPARAAVLTALLLLTACSSSDGPSPEERIAARPSPSASPAAPPSPTASPAAGAPTYVALGDSVAAGVGADDPARDGYVPVLAELLSDRLGCDDGGAQGCPVQVRNLAVPGATTQTLLRDQLPTALGLLRAGSVRTVTVTVGGNDVFLPVLQACARTPEAPSCASAVRAAITGVDAGVDRLLADLSGAAGQDATVAVMTYYDPLAACRLAPLQPLAEQVLEGTAGQDGLNDVLRARAAEYGAVVVDTAERLAVPADFVGGFDCLHPSASGHAAIAAAFAGAVAG